ncbi:MAG: hypothetical protein COU72_01820 [Parcubacteria group bacterium CG10_big_fil_rev_8_21_14_0_10_41_35]|nr:MAG: hypothetical protein COU72_01820 [Parcubacteria group bacterium CG10_big_fil_rev_8_21_14_0_10_41_35]
MSRLLKIFFLLAVFSLAALFTPRSAAATPQEFVKAVQEGNNLQWYLGGAQGMMSTTADSLFVGIMGAYDEQGKLIQAGAMQTTSVMMAKLYNKPASSVDYVAYLMNNSGLAKSAYAQGSGWDFLTKTRTGGQAPPNGSGVETQPILILWKMSRDIVYLFFVVIFVAIGFMIMFRSKLNPQTVVNVQLALPNIIVSLILVTFSYAICGLIIDTVFLSHKLIDAVYFSTNTKPFYNLLPDAAVGKVPYSEVVEKMDIISALLLPGDAVGGLPSPWEGLNVFSQLGDFLTNGIGKSIKTLLGAGDTNFFSNFIPLIFAFTILGVGIKIFFALITKYVTIILSTIFSPFIFLMSAFPGKTEGIGTFIRTVLSAALTFPATAFMFFLSAFFVSGKIVLDLNPLPPLNKTGIFEPGTATTGLASGQILEPLIAIGILMAATQVSQAIDQALGAKPGIAGAATPDVSSALSKIPIIGGLLR